MQKGKKPLTKQEFKTLRDKWYAKLAKDGFVDAEQVEHDEPMLKDWHSHRLDRVQKETYESTIEYYSKAAEFLATHQFNSAKQRKIWAMHAEGLTPTQIMKRVRISKSWLLKMISNLRAIMLKR